MSKRNCRCCGQPVPPPKGLNPIQRMEQRVLRAFLKKNGGNLSKTAQELGLCRLTVRKKAMQYGLLPKKS